MHTYIIVFVQVKALPLFRSQDPLLVNAAGNPVQMEDILVYYVDEKAPTMTMQRLTGGVIAVIVVVILVVLVGLVVLVSKTSFLVAYFNIGFRSIHCKT